MNKNILTQNIDKYGIINLIIIVSIPIIMALIIADKQDVINTNVNYNYEETTTTTTITTKQCQASPCPNKAEKGSSYCSIHKK